MKYMGLTLPDSVKDADGFVRRWKDLPEDPVFDDEVELTTHLQAVNRQRAVYAEEHLYRNKYFFLKVAIRQGKWDAGNKLWKIWMASRERDWANRYKNDERKAYKAAVEPYNAARAANEKQWKAYQKLYKVEMEEIKWELRRLHQKEEDERREQERLERERQERKARARAEEEARVRASWAPEYRAAMVEHERRTREKNRLAQEERKREHDAWMEAFCRKTDEELRKDAIAEIEGSGLKLTAARKARYVEGRVREWRADINRRLTAKKK